MSRIVIEKDFKIPCLEVKQGFGKFFACSITARDLLAISEPIRAEALDDEIDNGGLNLSISKSKGTQRQLGKNRPEQIAEYIKTGVAAFPNSIVVGANISSEGYLLEEDDRTWSFDGSNIIIKKGAFAAAIIDGQHRLSGFKLLGKDDPELDDELLCSVYLDITMIYHAQIFSTINSTQRRVNKNLIYQLYQIDMDEKEPKFWSPEVLAVYLSRALGVDEKSSLSNRVVLAVKNEDDNISKGWSVSLSSLVEGILRLFSSHPGDDRDAFYSKSMEIKVRSDLGKDSSPWRDRYLDMRDKDIYDSLLSYLNSCYLQIPNESAYRSSIGCSALLDAFRVLVESENGDISRIEKFSAECVALLNHEKIPDLKTSRNKGLLRDVVIASFMKKMDFKHKFNGKEVKDFDDYLK